MLYNISHGLLYRSAMLINESDNLMMMSMQFSQSIGTGLLLLNAAGSIIVVDSEFNNNALPNEWSSVDYEGSLIHGGAGLYIVVAFCDFTNTTCSQFQTKPAAYFINNTLFTNNTLNLTRLEDNFWSLSYGGGLGILLFWGANNNSFYIQTSNFTNNKASCGGGILFQCYGSVNGNTLEISDSFISNNSKTKYAFGGTGLAIGVAYNRQFIPTDNNVTVHRTRISNNSGFYGVGTLIYAAAFDSSINVRIYNYVQFNNCTWEDNVGVVSSAVEVEPDYNSQYKVDFSIEVMFRHCIVREDRIIEHYKNSYSTHKEFGVFLICKVKVYFSGINIFENNFGTALYISTANVLFERGSKTIFKNNKGVRGGAVYLVGYSSLKYKKNTQFDFVNNFASFVGGAICVLDKKPHASITSHSCFLEYSEHDTLFDATFNFHNNTAGSGLANSIFLTTIKPCYFACLHYHMKLPPINETFSSHNCLGKIYFSNAYINQVASEPSVFQVTRTPPLHVVPGELYTLPVVVLDDMNQNITNITIYQIKSSAAGNLTGDNDVFSFVVQNIVEIRGEPGEIKNITLTVSEHYGTGANIPIVLSECPPGYVLDINLLKCVCSTMLNASFNYNGIIGCLENQRGALTTPGYWFGYIISDADTPAGQDNLYSGDCPVGFCKYFNGNHTTNGINQLPTVPLIEELEATVCADNRKGILCSQCVSNYSVYFHSYTLKCGSNDLCHFGVLFYIIAEIVPITVLFILILRFDVSLTSGASYSLILMIQLKSTMIVPKALIHPKFLRDIYVIVYDIFNLEFFDIDDLSFCLWKGAGNLEMIVVKYVSVVYAIGLIVTFVNIANRCTCKCHHKCPTTNYSVVQGLNAFLVICYFQCTRVTFLILNYQTIEGKGGVHYRNVVQWDGELEYFQGKHLAYSLLALICLFLIVIPLPFILLFDGLLLRMEYYLYQRIKCHHNIHPWTSINRVLKPLLDSFQGTFKDKYRFFAGVFFLYRIIILSISVISPNILQYYFLLQFILVNMVVIQVLLRPFEKIKHNIIALLVLSNMALINALTMRLHIIAPNQDQTSEVYVLHWIRLIFIYLPIISVIGWCTLSFIKKQLASCKVEATDDKRSNSDDFPAEMFEREVYKNFDDIS